MLMRKTLFLSIHPSKHFTLKTRALIAREKKSQNISRNSLFSQLHRASQWINVTAKPHISRSFRFAQAPELHPSCVCLLSHTLRFRKWIAPDTLTLIHYEALHA